MGVSVRSCAFIPRRRGSRPQLHSGQQCKNGRCRPASRSASRETKVITCLIACFCLSLPPSLTKITSFHGHGECAAKEVCNCRARTGRLQNNFSRERKAKGMSGKWHGEQLARAAALHCATALGAKQMRFNVGTQLAGVMKRMSYTDFNIISKPEAKANQRCVHVALAIS